MAQKGTEAVDVLDIDALMNSQDDDKDAGAVVSSRSMNTLSVALKQENNDLGAGGTMGPVQNATVTHNGGGEQLMEVVDLTIPVKTEGEASPSVSTAVSVASGSASVRTTSQAVLPVASSPFDGLTNTITGMGTFGASPQLWSLGSQLQLSPEEQAAAYKKANIVALSALAKKGGPNVKEMLAVQAKLQEFLTSLIALAGKTGPHLKLTVQGLVQKLVTGAITVEEFASRIESDLHSQHQPSLLPFLKNSVPHLRARLQLQQAIMKELLQRMVQEKKQQQQPQMQQTTHQLPQQTAQQQLTTQSVQQVAQQTSQQVEQQMTTTTTTTSSQQQILSEPVKIPQPQSQQQQPQASQLHKSPVAVPANSKSPSPQLIANQVILKEQLAQLTPEQQKFLFMHQVRRQQIMMKQVQHQNTSSATTQPSVQTTSSQPANRSVQNFQAVMEKQQQLVKEQQVPLVMGGGGKAPNQLAAVQGGRVNQTGGQFTASSTGNSTQTTSRTSFANMKLSTFAGGGSSDHTAVKGKGKSRGDGTKGKQSPVLQEEEEEDERMDTSIAGVNLQEETAHFLPQTTGEMVSRTCRDRVLLDTSQLRQRVASIARLYGITNVSEDFLVMLSHATQERLEDIIEKLTMVSHHRVEVLKDDRQYEATSEVKGQLKVLETIDRINHKRKQEREKEKILRAAKSRSKAEDPETTAKIKEQAKQLQQEEEQKIRNKAANLTALAAIGRRKRPATALQQQDSLSAGNLSSLGGAEAGQGTSLPGSLSITRQHKRRITTRDLVFYMEQERETKKSLLLYKSLLK